MQPLVEVIGPGGCQVCERARLNEMLSQGFQVLKGSKFNHGLDLSTLTEDQVHIPSEGTTIISPEGAGEYTEEASAPLSITPPTTETENNNEGDFNPSIAEDGA